MSKEQLNVRVSPIYSKALNKIIESEKKKGRVVTKGTLIEEAIELLAQEYAEVNKK